MLPYRSEDVEMTRPNTTKISRIPLLLVMNYLERRVVKVTSSLEMLLVWN